MSIALDEAGELSVIRLDGEIDIAAAAPLKALLLQALASGREISVSLEAVTTLDVTAFQLLWSAARQARQAGLKFSVAQELSKPLQSSLEYMGFNGLFA